MPTKSAGISGDAHLTVGAVYLRGFVRRGLKTGALIGVVIGGFVWFLQPAGPGLWHPGRGFPGWRIFLLMVVGACALAVNPVLFGLMCGALHGMAAAAIPVVLATVVTVFASQDILNGGPAPPESSGRGG